MTEILIGVLIPVVAGGAVTLIAVLLKRASLRKKVYALVSAFRRWGFAADIPYIPAKPERKLKVTACTTLSDICEAGYYAFRKLPLPEDSDD